MIAIRNALLFLILIFGLPTYKAIATDASILPQGVTQFLDDDGNPLSTGKVYFYTPNTLTFKTTWQNAAKSITNTNPVDLDAGGRAIIYGDGSYRQIVKDSAGNTIYDAVTTAPLTGSTATLVGDGNLVSTVLPWAGLVAPAQYAFGYGQEIARATYPDFFTAITSSQTVGCTLASPTITGLSDTTQIIVGTAVELSCVAAGTTVLSKTLTTATLSANSSASTTATAVFFPWGNGNGSTTFNVPDLRGYNPVGRDNMGGTASARLANGNGLGRPLGIANFNYVSAAPQTNETSQLFTATGSQTYTRPAGVTGIEVTMTAAGGGGGARTTNSGGNGTGNTWVVSGGTTWTAVAGSAGVVGGSGGAGGGGGTGGIDGTGTLIARFSGQDGGVGAMLIDASGDGQSSFIGGLGGSTIFGGGGTQASASGNNARPNSGGGGAGGSSLITAKGGGGGGAGETVIFYITSPAATYTITVGAKGTGGAAGGNAGGNGADGMILVKEYYAATPTPVSTSFTATTAGTLEQQRTINYVVKITPDTSTSTATGVASLGGMTGVITCGSGLTCTSNNVAVSFPFFYTTLIASAQSVNLNSANTDNAMTVTLPSGTTNYRITSVMVQNNGTTASLTTATGGLFSAAAGGGLALAANQALSTITANAVNTDANSLALTQTVASRTVINSATLYFRVGTAQGAAATANVYVYGQPMP